MPIYEYCCEECEQQFEVMQKISEDPLTQCPHCGGKVRRLISPTAFVLKGSGWYVTDYPSADRKKAMEREKEGSKTSSSSDSSSSASPSSPASQATSKAE